MTGDERNESGVSVVMPAFNEEDAVAEQVRAVCEVMEEHGPPYEIIVVDDGSDDETPQRAAEANALVVRHAQNRGYGSALKTGIDVARYETIVMTDADASYPATAIPALLEALVDSDMAVGARTGSEVHVPLIRRPAKWLLRRLAIQVAGVQIPDLNSGLRAFRKQCVRQYLAILPDQFSFTTTITLSYLADGYRVVYRPINYYPRVGDSKIRAWHFMDFTMLVLRITMLFQPLRIFVPLALTCGALGVLKVVLDILAFIPSQESFGLALFYEEVLSISALLLLLVAVQLLAIGMVADSVLRRLAQQRAALVPSRAISVLSPSADVDDPNGAFTGTQFGLRRASLPRSDA